VGVFYIIMTLWNTRKNQELEIENRMAAETWGELGYKR
jgi:hypothetical protein